MLYFFSKLWAQIFRANLSVSNSFISGVFVVSGLISGGDTYPPPLLTLNRKDNHNQLGQKWRWIGRKSHFFRSNFEDFLKIFLIFEISVVISGTTFHIAMSCALDSNFISIWKHDFRCFFSFWRTQGDILPHINNSIFSTFCICIFYFFRYGGCTWPPEIGKHGFSPEMDVSERDKKNLKSGASNFEKQKNESILDFRTFFRKKVLNVYKECFSPLIVVIFRASTFFSTILIVIGRYCKDLNKLFGHCKDFIQLQFWILLPWGWSLSSVFPLLSARVNKI